MALHRSKAADDEEDESHAEEDESYAEEDESHVPCGMSLRARAWYLCT